MPVDLGRLEERADAERDRVRERLAEDCERYRAGTGTDPVILVQELLQDHPDDDSIYDSARQLIDELTRFTAVNDLLPELGGTCTVGPAPESRRFAMAMMSWNGAYEDDAPAHYYVNLPDAAWGEDAKEEWWAVFSTTTLPAITAHEVTPGHFAHGRMILRTPKSDVRRSLCSSAFVEGWAHYAEELLVEVGFRADDPRFAIGVWIEALVRVAPCCRARRAPRDDDGGGGDRAFRAGRLLEGAGRPQRGDQGHVRPDIRSLHLGQARDHGAEGRSDREVGLAL